MRLSEPDEARKHVPILQPILTKIDTTAAFGMAGGIIKGLRELVPMAAPPLLCAVKPNLSVGIEAVRQSMAQACSEAS